MQEPRRDDACPSGHHPQFRRKFGVSEQDGGNDAEVVDDLVASPPKRDLPEKRGDAGEDDGVGGYRRATGRIVVVERKREHCASSSRIRGREDRKSTRLNSSH